MALNNKPHHIARRYHCFGALRQPKPRVNNLREVYPYALLVHLERIELDSSHPGWSCNVTVVRYIVYGEVPMVHMTSVATALKSTAIICFTGRVG